MAHSPYGGPVFPPTRASGDPRTLQHGTVTVRNPDGTVDVKLRQTRGDRQRCPVFLPVQPAVGDDVLVCQLDGDPQTPAVVAAKFSLPSGGGGEGGTGNVFIGPDAPVDPPDVYVWFQTGLAPGGTGVSIWVEDGS